MLDLVHDDSHGSTWHTLLVHTRPDHRYALAEMRAVRNGVVSNRPNTPTRVRALPAPWPARARVRARRVHHLSPRAAGGLRLAKCRGFCSSYGARRMVETVAGLVEQVVPGFRCRRRSHFPHLVTGYRPVGARFATDGILDRSRQGSSPWNRPGAAISGRAMLRCPRGLAFHRPRPGARGTRAPAARIQQRASARFPHRWVTAKITCRSRSKPGRR